MKTNRQDRQLRSYRATKRFLRARVGLSWDRVYSELCDRFGTKHLEGTRARDFVDVWVQRNVRITADGKVLDVPSEAQLHDEFYVHPENGTLQFYPKPTR